VIGVDDTQVLPILPVQVSDFAELVPPGIYLDLVDEIGDPTVPVESELSTSEVA
jgi:hypothetical protein